jgi:hypothetical protein
MHVLIITIITKIHKHFHCVQFLDFLVHNLLHFQITWDTKQHVQTNSTQVVQYITHTCIHRYTHVQPLCFRTISQGCMGNWRWSFIHSLILAPSQSRDEGSALTTGALPWGKPRTLCATSIRHIRFFCIPNQRWHNHSSAMSGFSLPSHHYMYAR